MIVRDLCVIDLEFNSRPSGFYPVIPCHKSLGQGLLLLNQFWHLYIIYIISGWDFSSPVVSIKKQQPLPDLSLGTSSLQSSLSQSLACCIFVLHFFCILCIFGRGFLPLLFFQKKVVEQQAAVVEHSKNLCLYFSPEILIDELPLIQMQIYKVEKTKTQSSFHGVAHAPIL